MVAMPRVLTGMLHHRHLLFSGRLLGPYIFLAYVLSAAAGSHGEALFPGTFLLSCSPRPPALSPVLPHHRVHHHRIP